jgi:hypothetical protein
LKILKRSLLTVTHEIDINWSRHWKHAR